MEILLGLAFLAIAAIIYFVITYFGVILLVLFISAIVFLIIFAIVRMIEEERLKKVVRARIIGEEPIIETISEKTGHSQGYGYYYTYYEHFRDRDVITGYKVTFSVEYENGEKDSFICKRGSYTYKKLIDKVS